jgi:hypothetical protein
VRFRLHVRMSSILLLTLVPGAICPAQNVQVHPRPGLRAAAPLGESGAPIPVSPGDWSQLSKFVALPDAPINFFGSAVGVSGDTVVVGVSPDYTNPVAAYFFLKTAQGWRNGTPVAALGLPFPINSFNAPLAIDGDTVVIGLPAENYGYPSYAYVYVKPPGGWTSMTPTAILTPSDSVDGYFGQSVSISGNTIVVGDSGYNSSAGAAYVYVKPAGGWADMTQTAKLTASDGVLNDELGFSASVSGRTIALGAPQDFGFSASGKAYVFVEPAAGWTDMTETAELTVPGAQGGAEIGWSIALDGNVVVTGSPDISSSGAAYVFEKPASGWTDMTETATLLPGDVLPRYSDFGVSVGVSGKIVVVGAPGRGRAPNTEEGGIYVFEEPAGGWQNMSGRTVLTGSDARYYAFLGRSVGISGKVVVGGAEFFFAPGAAYVFGLP